MRNDELVKWLLKQGANPCIGLENSDQDGQDFCMQSGQVVERAASWGSLKTLNRLIKHAARYDLGLPLHRATWAKEFTDETKAVMERLLSLGRDINQQDDARGYKGRGTPLCNAAIQGSIETVRFLLEHGADPSVKNRWGNTADKEAESEDRSDIAEVIRKWRAGASNLQHIPPAKSAKPKLSRFLPDLARWIRER